jgi:translocation and assembly module TamB
MMPRWRKVLRTGVWTSLALGAVLLLAVWFAASGPALRWAARYAVETVEAGGGRLSIEGLERAGLAGLRVASVIYRNDAVRVEARDAGVFLSPRSLFARRWVVTDLIVGELRITPVVGSATPPALPASLALPVDLEVRQATIHRLVVAADGTVVLLRDLQFTFLQDATQQRLAIERIVTPWAVARGALAWAHHPPFAAEGTLVLQAEAAGLGPVSVAVEGRLEALGIGVAASLHGAPMIAGAAVRPFSTGRVLAAKAQVTGLDARLVLAAVPRSSLDIRASVAMDRSGMAEGRVDVVNTMAGPLARGLLPLRRIEANFFHRDALWSFADLVADAPGVGRVTGKGSYRDAILDADLATSGFDLRGLHPPLRATALAGTATLRLNGAALDFRASLAQQGYRLTLNGEYAKQHLHIRTAELGGAAGSVRLSADVVLSGAYAFDANGILAGFDPSRIGDYPPARLDARFDAKGSLTPLRADLDLRLGNSRFRGQPLAGRARLTIDAVHLADVDARLDLGGAVLVARGAFGRAGDSLAWSADVPDARVFAAQARGTLKGAGTLAGTLAAPAVDLRLAGNALRWGQDLRVDRIEASGSMAEGTEGVLRLSLTADRLVAGTVRAERVHVEGSGTRVRHVLDLSASQTNTRVEARARGGLAAGNAWAGELATFDVRGPIVVRLLGAVGLEAGPGSLRIGAAKLQVDKGRVALGGFDWQDGRIATTGVIEAFPLAALRPLWSVPEVVGALSVGGRWDVVADRTVDGTLSVWREQGDLVLSAQPRVDAGLRTLRVDVEARGSEIRARAQADGSVLGQASAALTSRVVRRDGVWGLPGDAPLQVTARASMGSLAWTRALWGDEVLLDGRAEIALDGNGTVAAPDLSGDVTGSGLAVRVPEHGISLQDGRFSGRWNDRRLEISVLEFKGGKGRTNAVGSVGLEAGKPDMRLDVTAERLALVSRPDRLVVVSGKGRVSLAGGRFEVTGDFVADQGLIELAREDKPVPSRDVVVKGRAPAQDLPVRIVTDLQLGLGSDFRLRGRGVDAQLQGSVRLRSEAGARPALHGTVRVSKGTYSAFGQRLTIDRGVVNFDGAPDNPALDVLAVRKGLAVEAGVAVGGTAQLPRIRLVSNPAVSDADKLAWLTLGHGLDQSGRNEASVLQAAAQALFARGDGPALAGGIAQAFGLDELSFAGRGEAGEQILSFGKRLAANVYVGFERGLTGAVSVMKIQLDLSRRWSVQARAGSQNAVDLFYTLGFR